MPLVAGTATFASISMPLKGEGYRLAFSFVAAGAACGDAAATVGEVSFYFELISQKVFIKSFCRKCLCNRFAFVAAGAVCGDAAAMVGEVSFRG